MNKTALYIFLFFTALYAIFSIGHYGGDGYQDYLTAESIVLDGNLSLDDRPQDKDDLDYQKAQDLGNIGKDGKLYSSRRSSGMPWMLVPFYLAGHILSMFLKNVPHDYVTMLAVSFTNPLMCALSCMMLFLIARKMEFNVRISAVLSLIFGLSTMLPVYARTGFADPAGVLFMLLAVHSMLKYGASFRLGDLFLSSLCLALMVFCKSSSILFIPCFLFYLIWINNLSTLPVRIRAGHVLLFIAVFGVSFLGILSFNWFIYGDPCLFGGTNVGAIGKRIAEAPHMLKGFYYYLLSTGKGFFLYNIPVVFAFLALDRAYFKRRKTTILFLLIVAVNLFFSVKSFRRGSLFCWGPRYLLPSVPLLILLAGYYLEKFKSIASKIAIGVASLAGFLIMLPCMLVNQSKFYLFVVEKLGLEEYMINFIPDLSPMGGAWWMLASRIGWRTSEFVYAPDWRLVKPVSALMDGYNYVDIWFLKVMEKAPGLMPAVLIMLLFLGAVSVFSLYKICRAK